MVKCRTLLAGSTSSRLKEKAGSTQFMCRTRDTWVMQKIIRPLILLIKLSLSSHHKKTDLPSLWVSEFKVINVPGPSVCQQHLMPLLVRHLLVVGLIQGDPHLHIISQFSVAEPGIVCKGFWDLTGKQINSLLQERKLVFDIHQQSWGSEWLSHKPLTS